MSYKLFEPCANGKKLFINMARKILAKKNEIDSEEQNKGKKKRISTKYNKEEDEMLQDGYKPCDYYL